MPGTGPKPAARLVRLGQTHLVTEHVVLARESVLHGVGGGARLGAAVQTALVDVNLGVNRETVAEYARTWFDRQLRLKASTRSRYAAVLRVHILPRFGPVPLRGLERSELSNWITELSVGGLSGPTARHIHKIMHRVLQAATLDGRIARNPASGIKLTRDRGRDKRFPSSVMSRSHS